MKPTEVLPPVGERWTAFEQDLIRSFARVILNVDWDAQDLTLKRFEYHDDNRSVITINVGPTSIEVEVIARVTRNDLPEDAA